MLQLIQVALVTSDLAASVQLYAEAFGFRNAGGQCSWGSRVQGLGSDSRHLMWWLVGRQPFFQLELFQYSRPRSRPLPSDWRPCDHGWVRFGIVVDDVERCLCVLAEHDIAPISPPIDRDGRTRFAFRDPYVGAIIEVIEAETEKGAGPAILYATSSVSNLQSAREFYGDLLELEILLIGELHEPGDEAIWGLPDARREGFLVSAYGIVLEIVRYLDPAGRTRPADHRISDLGIMNVALGARHAPPVRRALDRLERRGLVPPFRFEQGENLCGYITAPGREIEFVSVPEAMDEVYGFAPAPLGFVSTRADKV